MSAGSLAMADAATANRWPAFLELAKPRIQMLVAVTVVVGAQAAAPFAVPAATLLAAVVGTLLIGSGAAVFNHWFEIDTDRRMRRTQVRPMPTGLVQPWEAALFGWALSVAGVVVLAVGATPRAAAAAVASWVLYVLVYTPLKRLTAWNTVVGALPGALPCLVGSFAVDATPGPAAWGIFLVVVWWQFPHFLAIAWLLKDQYAGADIRMMSTTPLGRRWIGATAVATMLATSATLHWTGHAGDNGWMFTLPAAAADALFLLFTIRFAANPERDTARRLMLASVAYLPFVLLLFSLTLPWGTR